MRIGGRENEPHHGPAPPKSGPGAQYEAIQPRGTGAVFLRLSTANRYLPVSRERPWRASRGTRSRASWRGN